MGGRRRTWALLASTLAVFGTSFPGTAAGQIPVGGWTSPNVEWLGNVTLSGATGAITGTLHGDYFYAEGLEAIEIFDVSDPAVPQRMGRIPMPGPAAFDLPGGYGDLQRDPPDTNGRILVHAHEGSPHDAITPRDRLVVYDIRDKSSPELLASLSGIAPPVLCLAACRWVYSGAGQLVDLRHPTRPKLVGRWDEGLRFHRPPWDSDEIFSFEEVAPGRVLLATTPMYLLDTSAPARPRVIARSDGSPYSQGAAVWPAFPEGRMVVTISQSLLFPRCEVNEALRGSDAESAFKTWDASHWRGTGFITGLSEYRLDSGTYQDGDPAFSGAVPFFWGCGTTGVDAHPGFRDEGLVAVAGSGHGVKFLQIDKKGAIEEVGWFLPYANDTFGAYWITAEIVYTVDWPRGIDILRFDANA